jgi:carbon storage regulator
MLVLTRRIGEEIVINDNIRLTVLAVRGGQIRLGLSAPPSVHVVRSELIERDAANGLTGRFQPLRRVAPELRRHLSPRRNRDHSLPKLP